MEYCYTSVTKSVQNNDKTYTPSKMKNVNGCIGKKPNIFHKGTTANDLLKDNEINCTTELNGNMSTVVCAGLHDCTKVHAIAKNMDKNKDMATTCFSISEIQDPKQQIIHGDKVLKWRCQIRDHCREH